MEWSIGVPKGFFPNKGLRVLHNRIERIGLGSSFLYDQCFNSEKNIVPLEYPSRIFPFMHLIKRFTLRVLTDGINKFEAIKNFMLAEDFQLLSEIRRIKCWLIVSVRLGPPKRAYLREDNTKNWERNFEFWPKETGLEGKACKGADLNFGTSKFLIKGTPTKIWHWCLFVFCNFSIQPWSPKGKNQKTEFWYFGKGPLIKTSSNFFVIFNFLFWRVPKALLACKNTKNGVCIQVC